ncbi:MAG: hypothetical protein RI967_1476, partial [Planctomycetota bacterium]
RRGLIRAHERSKPNHAAPVSGRALSFWSGRRCGGFLWCLGGGRLSLVLGRRSRFVCMRACVCVCGRQCQTPTGRVGARRLQTSEQSFQAWALDKSRFEHPTHARHPPAAWVPTSSDVGTQRTSMGTSTRADPNTPHTPGIHQPRGCPTSSDVGTQRASMATPKHERRRSPHAPNRARQNASVSSRSAPASRCARQEASA